MLNDKKRCAIILTGMIITSGFLYNGQVVATDAKLSREQQFIEWDKAGIDVNFTEEIDEIRRYVSNEIEPDTFASLHIDREEHLSGVIVLSFTKELSADVKKEILALVEDPTKVEFRVVKYTEEQLMKKQKEIDTAVFENEVFEGEEISVYHTSSDIIINKVEVGIAPYSDATKQLIFEHFGSEMVTVVEGQQMELLTLEDSSTSTDVSLELEVEGQQRGIFTKFWNWLSGLFY